jgi:hypothetical protein
MNKLQSTQQGLFFIHLWSKDESSCKLTVLGRNDRYYKSLYFLGYFDLLPAEWIWMGGQTADYSRQVSDITRTVLECHLSFMSYTELTWDAGCIHMLMYGSLVRKIHRRVWFFRAWVTHFPVWKAPSTLAQMPSSTLFTFNYILFSEDRWFRGQDLNQGLADYEAGSSTTRTRRSDLCSTISLHVQHNYAFIVIIRDIIIIIISPLSLIEGINWKT